MNDKTPARNLETAGANASTPAAAAAAPAPQRPLWIRRAAARAVPVCITLAVTAAAIAAAFQLWDHYELAPWTRDGRVRANVVQIAPDVSGLVTDVPVHDNQRVRAGQMLFEVDSARYALALRQAETSMASQRIALAQARREDARNAGLGNLISQEVREQTRTKVEQAQAALAQAQVSLDTAKLNLQRARILAPSDAIVTNLDLRKGSYASAGHAAMALVDADSFYVEGYFEETKLARIHIGDPVKVTPMGASRPLTGTVESVVAGIADRDRATSANLLPTVNPTFNWVRLAQRVPVRVKLDPLPADVALVAGQTVTVEVTQPKSTGGHKG
ncbi:efflux RND transporter periplasmic adaptor subunit [Diaphorobacter ruginosibacter]|uniref:Efflux RND transporter periplasmic adaptor subunit n=1 Tax=Diaphorobacter ruginosibacter TaxID=1715720 RepID=A0A7G9RNA4_9BURK|nr:efflux RND transporter periplasmic adaptor subunit [Diaphorobacter ruginosibacter]QNN57079.1 efflux RND transporter periplasmic adaptor subunit [Diaphorobacter ruginosibacter]